MSRRGGQWMQRQRLHDERHTTQTPTNPLRVQVANQKREAELQLPLHFLDHLMSITYGRTDLHEQFKVIPMSLWLTLTTVDEVMVLLGTPRRLSTGILHAVTSAKGRLARRHQ